MSDLPTLSEARYWVPCPDGQFGDNPNDCQTCHGLMFVEVGVPLLTREEAANDPEVRRIVLREWKNKTRWEVTDDE